jgi:DNA-binding response OmpR family regulator
MTQTVAGSPFILVVEDNPVVVELVSRTLRLSGYHVKVVATRALVLEQLAGGDCAAIVLDLGLPGDDGIQIARVVRERSNVPILMLTGRAGIHERVAGLEAGADDYLVKPFAPEELIARLRAVLRRMSKPRTEGEQLRELALRLGGTRVDLATGEARGPSGSARLTGHELRLLRALGRTDGPLGRAAAYREIFKREWDPQDRSLDVHVANLRRKLEAVSAAGGLICTVRGEGYELRSPCVVETAALQP